MEDIPALKFPEDVRNTVQPLDDTASRLETSPSPSLQRRRRWYEWFEPGTTREEKTLLLKLDFYILLFISMSFFIKSLDQSNVTNAYVSGMARDLHLNSNQLNLFTTYYNIGIIVGAPIVTLTLTKVSPGVSLPFCILLTSVFVLCMYKAQSAETIYALRFFAGLFSSGVLPGAFYILGSWYRRGELARRSVLSMISFYAGNMVSGYIQIGLIKGMNGRDGLAAWRWLFIFDAIIGIPVALFGFVFCPDAPHKRKPWWMKDNELVRARLRLTTDGRNETDHFHFPATIISLLRSWQVWCFPIAYGMLLTTCMVLAPQFMTLYLRSTKKYSLSQINAIPTTVSCATILVNLIAGAISDYIGNFAVVIFSLGLMFIFGVAVLAAWPASNAFRLAMYIVTGSSYGAIFPLQTAWANASCGGHKYLRALTTGFMSTLGYTAETVAQQYLFPTSQAPRYSKTHGYFWSLGWAIATIVWTCFLIPALERYFHRRQQRLRTSE